MVWVTLNSKNLTQNSILITFQIHDRMPESSILWKSWISFFEPFLASFMLHWCPNADPCDDHIEDKYNDKAFMMVNHCASMLAFYWPMVKSGRVMVNRTWFVNIFPTILGRYIRDIFQHFQDLVSFFSFSDLSFGFLSFSVIEKWGERKGKWMRELELRSTNERGVITEWPINLQDRI